MRRLWLLALVLVPVAGLPLIGCTKVSPPQPVSVTVVNNPNPSNGQPTVPAATQVAQATSAADPTTAATPAADAQSVMPVAPPEPAPQEKYDSALLDALNLLADRKYADALTALEAARAVQDTDQVRLEIEKVKKLLDQQAAAEHTVLDIQTVLSDGKVDAAATLAATALQEYGGTDVADQVAQLKRQADALAATQLTDNAARKDRFRQEGEAALKDRNLRAAAIAYEQALACGDDANLRRQLDDVRATLTQYDENRQRAADLRRDPANLEDAIAAFQEAQKAWDTLQVRQDLDDCSLALQKRRDRISVADFAIRGDVGIPEAGRTLAEELLPAFKGRFDLVEREQLGKVVAELKLEASDLADNDGGRREVGRLAKVRYLVLGSITRVSGLVVNARLVDVRTGLIVQTAKIVAPSPDELFPLLPQLANVLMMTDEQKIAYAQQAQQVAAAVTVAQPVPVPPAPEPPVAEQPAPAPIIVNCPRPPDLGGIAAVDFEHLPAPPPPGQAPALVVVAETPVKQRLLQVSLELGDNLFRRGCYKEAHRHFEFALTLAPEHAALRLRVERCRPYLPPPPPPPAVVIVETAPPTPPPPPRPRLAVLNFAELGDPNLIPPGLGTWTADSLAPYFCPPYEVIDRGEVFWYMARLGMTLRDLMCDPSARLWLARALHVRYFLLGSLRPGDAILADTHLVDAEIGCEVGGARVAVRDPWELKLRLAELARLTLMGPEERLRYQREAEGHQDLLVQAQLQFDRGEFTVSLGLFEKLLQARPDDIRVQVLVERCRHRSRQTELEAVRRRAWEQQQAQLAEMQQRQWELARAAEAARLRAEQEAAALGEAERRLKREQCELAHAQLLLQAQAALKQQNFSVSIQFYESALALRPTDDGYRELAMARARAAAAARARAAEVQAAREVDLRRQREAELAQLRTQVDQERRRHEAEERARNQALADRDQAEYTRLLDEGQRLLASERYDRAVLDFQGARNLRRTDEADRLLGQALVEQARATAQKKGARERAELERQLAAEKSQREQAEAEARRNRDLYTTALQLAQQAQAEKRYEVAIVKYHEAEKVYRTDAVLTGLHQVEAAQAAVQTLADAEQRKHVEDKRRADEALLKLTEGEKALQSQQYDKAVQAYREASKLAPRDINTLAGLSKAEQARADAAARARRQKDDADRQANFRTLVAGGKANLAAKQYDAAALSLAEAVRLNPADAEAKAALAQAQQAQTTARVDAPANAEADRKAAAYQKWVGEGRVALSAKQYDTAINAFREAQKLLPGDQASAALVQEAERGQREANAAGTAETRRRDEDQKRIGEVRKALAAGRTALAAHNVEAAARSFDTAARLAPQDPEVQRAQQDLQKAQETARAENDTRQKRNEAYHLQMKAGHDALSAQRYDDAVRAFGEANGLMPDDRTAQDLLQQSKKLQVAAGSRPISPTVPTTRPATPEVNPAVAEAERRMREEVQRREHVSELLTAGRLALSAHKLDVADKAFSEANKLSPQDPGVAKAQQDLAAARSAVAADAERNRRQAAYQEAMQAGRAALAAKHYEEAVKAFTEASRQQPGDAAAAAQLKEAEKGRVDAQVAAEAAAHRQQEQQQRRVEYNRQMSQGEAALAAKRYEEAIKAFTEASRLEPGDAEAMRQLRNATQALDASRVPPPKPPLPASPKPQPQPTQPRPVPAEPPVRPQQPPSTPHPEFNRLLTQGQTALTQKRYDEAVKAFDDALKLQPGDATATKGMREATAARDAARIPPPAPQPQPPAPPRTGTLTPQMEFAQHMAEGQKLQAAKRYLEATREYEAALKLQPNNAEATAALKRAREGKP
jgi:tetratricopeptide (TPR) repeat protein